MDTNPGWLLDPVTLREVITDRDALEQTLAQPNQLLQLQSLRILGRLAAARALAGELLTAAADRARALEAIDPWELYLAAADVYSDSGDQPATERLHAAAWRAALSRDRQAGSLHRMALAHVRAEQFARAGTEFELAMIMRQGFGSADLVGESAAGLQRVRARLDFDAIVLAGGHGLRMGLNAEGADKPGQKLAGWPLIDHVLIAVSAANRRIVVGPRRRTLTNPEFCREEPAGTGPLAAIAAAVPRVQAPFVVVLAADLPFVASALVPLQHALHDDQGGGGQPHDGHSGGGQPHDGHSSGGQPHDGHSSAGQPRDGHSSAGQPHDGHSSAGQPHDGHTSAGQPHDGHTSAGQPHDGHSSDVAVLVDLSGRANYLAAMWRTASLRRLLQACSEQAEAACATARFGGLKAMPVRELYQRARVLSVPDFDAAGADCDTRDDLERASERITHRNREQLSATPLAWPRLELYSPS